MAPYQFNQKLPFDIDYKVIGTFTEFYIQLLRFANYKLYSELGISYPPTETIGTEIFLNSDHIQKLQSNAQKKFNQQYTESVEQIGVSEEFKNTPEMKELTAKHEQLKRQRKLFSKCTFLLNREVPVFCLQFIILSFGGSYVTLDDLDANAALKFTHHVMDRPLATKKTNVEYVQPQYLLDSINNLFLLPTSQYLPGVSPPAHLSPFIDNQKEGYQPDRSKEIAHLKGEEIVESESEDEVVAKPVKKSARVAEKEAAK